MGINNSKRTEDKKEKITEYDIIEYNNYCCYPNKNEYIKIYDLKFLKFISNIVDKVGHNQFTKLNTVEIDSCQSSYLVVES